MFYTVTPHVTSGAGSVSVLNADGMDAFTSPGQPYYSYPQIVPAHGESSRKVWQWRLSGDVQSWQFDLDVAADVPSKIRHVVIIMQENRSFDHYSGRARRSWRPPHARAAR